MQLFGLISLLVTLAVAGWWFASTELTTLAPESSPTVASAPLDPVIEAHIAEKAAMIKVTAPQPNELVKSPLTITGEARGMWFFEASFPVVLTNWDGLIIAEGVATAQGDWMTDAFVPFVATLTFENPYKITDPDFMKRGSLILKKDNPSGLPERDDALEFPITFLPQGQAGTEQSPTTYNQAIDAAKSAADSISY